MLLIIKYTLQSYFHLIFFEKTLYNIYYNKKTFNAIKFF